MNQDKVPQETEKKKEAETKEKVLPDFDPYNPKVKISGLKINLGSGIDYRTDYINVDAYDKTADIIADATKLPFNDNSAAQIIAFELLEHVSMPETPQVLAECFRVLKKDGTLAIIVPDMLAICEKFVANPENEWYYARFFGSQCHPGQFHKQGFTIKRLSNLLGMAGFRTFFSGCFLGGDDKHIYMEGTK